MEAVTRPVVPAVHLSPVNGMVVVLRAPRIVASALPVVVAVPAHASLPVAGCCGRPAAQLQPPPLHLHAHLHVSSRLQTGPLQTGAAAALPQEPPAQRHQGQAHILRCAYMRHIYSVVAPHGGPIRQPVVARSRARALRQKQSSASSRLASNTEAVTCTVLLRVPRQALMVSARGAHQG